MRVLLSALCVISQANGLLWDIKPLQDEATAIFSESTQNEELRLHYELTDFTDDVVPFAKLFDFSCTTPLSSTNPFVTAEIEFLGAASGGGGTVPIDAVVDFNTETIASSDLWIQSGNIGQISLCVRIELLHDSGHIVAFHETSTEVFVDLAVGFSSASVSLNRVGPQVVTDSADVTFSVDACQCVGASILSTDVCTVPSAGIYGGDGTDESLAGSAPPALVQNSILDLCLSTSSTKVNIVEIQSLFLDQTGGPSRNPIADSVPDVLTVIGAVGDHINVISTRLVSGFFATDIPESLVASGTVLLEFDTTGETRRQLGNIRILQTSEENTFQAEVKLTKFSEGVSDGSWSSATTKLLSMAAILVSAVLCF